MSEAAVEFLKQHGHQSLVSLGCGHRLNRLDNHIKLKVSCELKYYVAIDRVTQIQFDPQTAFSDANAVNDLLASYYAGKPDEFSNRLITFPDTYVEELENIPCQVVVCQRILPFRHWEPVIKSMQPILILQEDLRGCELQNISRKDYKRTYPGIVYYDLQPFRASRLIPGENNIILWRRRDFFPCAIDARPWWERFFFRLSRTARTKEILKSNNSYSPS